MNVADVATPFVVCKFGMLVMLGASFCEVTVKVNWVVVVELPSFTDTVITL